MTGVPLQVGGVDVVGSLVQWLLGVLGLLPRLVVAAVLLALAYVVGGWLGERAQWLAERMDLGEAVLETPLGVVFEEAGEVGDVLEASVFYLALIVGVVVAASMAGFTRVYEISAELARYLPSVVGAIAVVLVGFVVAGYVGRSVEDSEVVGGYPFTPVLATTLQSVIYFVVVTLALDALGYSTAILDTLAWAVAIGVGFGVALAIGIAVGLGSQDYVAEHVEEWTEN